MTMSLRPDELRFNSDNDANAPDKVLIAEDDPVFRHALETWLKRWNYHVVAVDNGLDAWNALQRENAPQMAILDWVMPVVDGIELCRRVRRHEHGRYLYIVLVTARDNKHDVVAGLEAGADDYLTKPFNVDELRARIRAGARILQLQDALLRAREALQFEADHDHLTGVWNRGAILDLLRRETQRHLRDGTPLGVMMADLDHFKKVNDFSGHLIGDVVLHESARRMAAAVRNYDWVGRYGGEEFLILLPGCDAQDLAASAERIRSSISDRPIETRAGPIVITVSIGVVSTMPAAQPAPGYEALLCAADLALYSAKANGRNRVEIGSASQAAAHGAQ